MKKNTNIPKYQEIAADLASKIVSGDLKEQDRLFARSDVATLYGVSSETARRAILVLEDLQIVKAVKGSGVTITSYQNALRFVRNFEEVKSTSQIKEQLKKNMENQKVLIDEASELMDGLLNRSSRLQAINPFAPFQIEIKEDCKFIGQTLGELNFWHQTSATIVGYRRNDQLQLSCGPYATLEVGDIYYFIGDEDCIERVLHFLYA